MTLVLAAGALLITSTLGGGIYIWAHKSKPPTMQYQTLAVTRGPLAAKVAATGTLSALVMVNVGSQVSGRIATLRADFGSRVQTGDVVATIEPSLFQAAVQQAQANLAVARAGIERANAQLVHLTQIYERAKTLTDETAVSQADLDAASANVRVGRAEVKAAQASEAQALAALDQAVLNLRYTTIVSPIDGVVISRNVDVGQTVAAVLQTPTLFTIAQDLQHMQIDTSVPEADVGKIRQEMPVSFSVDAYPGRTFTGRVRQVRDNAQSVQNVVTYDAVIDVDNAELLLKPGMTASVTFLYAQRDNAVSVPNAALRFHPDPSSPARTTPPVISTQDRTERLIWLLREGRAEAVRVRVGISDGTYSELLDGAVKPGERAIIEALDNANAKHGT